MAAVALHFTWYNFCRVHQTLRVTPAMEAGITEPVWSIADIVALPMQPRKSGLSEFGDLQFAGMNRRSAVQRIAFHQLPRWVRLAAALTLFNTWVLIAEFVIDRYGLDEFLPFYRYGDVCLWDIAVIIGIAVLFVRASRIPRDSASLAGNPAVPTR